MGKRRKGRKMLVLLLAFIMVCTTFLGNISMTYAQAENNGGLVTDTKASDEAAALNMAKILGGVQR